MQGAPALRNPSITGHNNGSSNTSNHNNTHNSSPDSVPVVGVYGKLRGFVF